jgi:hypothetical protein
LDNVLLPDARQAQPQTPMQTLVQALSGDPLFAALERPGGKTLVLTVNLDEGDLTFRTVFPIMITNSLAWFAGQSAELRESLSAGAIAEIELPRDGSQGADEQLLLRSPTGEERPLSSGLLKTTIGPLDHCGIWSVLERKENSELGRRGAPAAATQAPPAATQASPAKATQAQPASRADQQTDTTVVELACNLASRSESELRVPRVFLTRPPSTQAAFAAGWFVHPIWFYLLAVAWLISTVEWWLYQRRWLG